jgi:hypothetical protein
MPGTLEFAIHTLVETRIDRSIFDNRYENDETGRFAYSGVIRTPIPEQSGHLFHLIPDTDSCPFWILYKTGSKRRWIINPQAITLLRNLRRDSWLKGDYLCARSKRFFDSIMKKGFQPDRLPRA